LSSSCWAQRTLCKAGTTKWVGLKSVWPLTSANASQGTEVGVVQALCKLQVPRCVLLIGFVTYQELSEKASVCEDRLKHLVRIAAVCSEFLAETANDEVTHSDISHVWQPDPTMATGMQVKLDHLPEASYKLGEVCAQDPSDERSDICGFNPRSESTTVYISRIASGRGERFCCVSSPSRSFQSSKHLRIHSI
jgi:hypothetical protein